MFRLSFLFIVVLFISGRQKQVFTPTEESVRLGVWGIYLFDKGSYADSSGNRHDMTPRNGLKIGNDQNSATKGAMEFDGKDDFSVIYEGKSFPAGDFSISMHIYPYTSSGRIFNKANYNNAKGASLTFGFNDDDGTDQLCFGITNDPSVCSVYSDVDNTSALFDKNHIPSNKWSHVVIQKQEGKQRIFLNSKLVSEKNVSKSYTMCNQAPLYFGIWWAEDLRPFRGRMDNIRIFTRAISTAEIEFLFKKRK